tara:strand:- start:645 stop:887 length:243 start_codon:yes stop_codon:yes gene_type:complete
MLMIKPTKKGRLEMIKERRGVSTKVFMEMVTANRRGPHYVVASETPKVLKVSRFEVDGKPATLTITEPPKNLNGIAKLID